MGTSKTNEYIKKRWGKSQIELAQAIAKIKGGHYNSYKGYVNKWFKTNQEPGKDYLLILSQILGAPVESILRGEDIDSFPESRPTAYLAAITENEEMINKLFGCEAGDEGIYINTTDEYGCSFMRYVVNFKKYKALKIAIKNGHCILKRYGYNWEGMGNEIGSGFEDDVLSMIIENDDLELFLKIVGRYSCFTEETKTENIPIKYAPLVLNSDNIFNYYLSTSPLTEGEIKAINRGSYTSNEKGFGIPSVHAGFNDLIKYSVETDNYDKLELLLKSAEKTVSLFKNLLFSNDKPDIKVRENFLMANGNWCSFLPYVTEAEAIKSDELKKQALSINAFVEKIRRDYGLFIF